MSLQACAALVEKGDPLRFRVAMAAPVPARRILFPLYAFNIEIARAPWVTQEPMIAEMRLQWWRDALEEIAAGGLVRRHEVVDALAGVLDPAGARCLDGLIAARRWDIYQDPFEDSAHFESYLQATSGHLMLTAARLLGPVDEAVLRDFAYAVGVANLFQAAPALIAKGRQPFLDQSHDGLRALARQALARLDAARKARRGVSPAAAPALMAGYHARPILRMALAEPARIAADRLIINPATDSLRFLRLSLTGWWR